jgi:type IX secretion system PorP/SprF family membrane protein
MIKKAHIIFFLFLFIVLNGFSQDPIFSQFYANPLYLNPAFTGSTENTRITAGYRNEWPTIKAYSTYSFSIDQPLDIVHGGIGLSIIDDVWGGGAYNNLKLGVSYAYEASVGRETSMWFGLMGAYGQRSFNSSKLRFSSAVNPDEQFNETITGIPKKIYWDFDFGVLVARRNTYGGFAIHHLTSPRYSLGEKTAEMLNRKYTLHLGQNMPTNTAFFGRERLYISPNILLQMQGALAQQINYGLYLDQSPFIMGLWLRQSIRLGLSAFIVSLGVSQKNFQIGYSYDLFLNRYDNLIKSSAHEVTFLLKFKYKSKRKRRGAIKCPEI